MDYNDDSDYNEFPSSSPIIKIDSKSINITPISENGIDDDNNHDIKTDENDPELTKLQLYAKSIIVKAWKRYLDRKTFQILKNSLYEIKKLCTSQILRKLNPRESVLFEDPLSRGKIRFRFGGETFPPYIYYKIYSNGQNIHYFSGYRILNSFSDAYRDAYKLMGNRNFEKVINKDNVWNSNCDITDASDVTSTKEYIQYMNSMDKKPIYLGGRNNGWRELSTLSISLPLYEKEISNIYDRHKNIFSSNSRNSKIATKKVNKARKKNNVNEDKPVKTKKSERKAVKLISEKKSNLRKQKARIKRMQQMYQMGKNQNQEIAADYEEEEPSENISESIEDTENSSYYDSYDDSIDSDEEEFSDENNINFDDIENDDFHSIYEWANELSYENTINDVLSDIKI